MTEPMNEDEVHELLGEFQQMRGWIINTFAQVEFALADLVMRCRQFPEYAEHTADFPYTVEKRISAVRKILALDGPLADEREGMGERLDEFENSIKLRNLIVHGFATFIHDADRKWAMLLSLWQPQPGNPFVTTSETFSPEALGAIAEYSKEFATVTMERLRSIHQKHGWGE